MYEPRRVNLSVLAPRQNVSCNTNKACHKRSIAEILTKVRFPYAVGRNFDPLSLDNNRVDAWDQVVLLPLLSSQYLNNVSMVHGSHPITVPRCCWIEFDLIFDLSGTHHITTLSWVGCGFSWVWSSVEKKNCTVETVYFFLLSYEKMTAGTNGQRYNDNSILFIEVII